MLRTAIVGLGTVAEHHWRALDATPDAAVCAVVDTDTDRTETVATELGVEGYGDVETMLSAAAPDWVHVCTPAGTHRDVTESCLAAGAHVLVEKPFVLDRADYETLMTMADRRDLRVTVVHNQVFYEPLRRARRRLNAGEFGDLHGVSVRWAEDLDPTDPDRGEWVLDLPGGEFGEGIVHPIYTGLRFAGYPASDDAVSVHRIDAADTGAGYDGIAVSYRTADGTTCTIQHHSNVPDGRRVDLYATDGTVTVDVPTQSVTVRRENFGPNASADDPLTGAALDRLRRAVGAVADAMQAGRSDRPVHDTHTPVVRREAKAIRGDGPGPTPRPEADWTNRIFTRMNDLG